MSKVNFENCPPSGVLVVAPKAGEWVKCVFTGAHGVVDTATSECAHIHWAGGEKSTEPIGGLQASAPTVYLQAIQKAAADELEMDAANLAVIHDQIAGERDPMSLEVLSELEQTVLGKFKDSLNDDFFEAVANDPKAAEVETASTTPDAGAIPAGDQSSQYDDFTADAKDEGDIFAAFGTSEPEPEAQPALNPKLCAMCQNVGVNKSSPVMPDGSKVCKRCHLGQNSPVSNAESAPGVETSADVAESAAEPAGSNTDDLMEQLAQTAADMKQELTETFEGKPESTDTASAVPVIPTTAEAAAGADHATELVKTDAGFIDPETGENVSPSLIMRKFGWSEMPYLPENPTKEQLDQFQDKIDQVGDRIQNNRERAARYRAQTEQRCKPLDESANFWEQNFVIPMAKQLAKYRMPKKGKTIHLPSCSLKFTQTGGAFVHDKALVQAHIAKEGVEKFAAIGAELVITYDYQKLVSALNKGTLKNIPGTGIKDKDPKGKVSLVSAKAQTEDQPDADES